MSDTTSRDRWLTAGIFAAAAFEILGWLGHYALWDPDEGRHAAIARELFFARTWQGWIITPYHDKPILYYWLTSLAYAGVGVDEVGARLVSALAAIATLVALHRWMALRWDGRTARLGVVVLASTAGFVGLGRYGSLDMLLACVLSVGLFAAAKGAIVFSGTLLLSWGLIAVIRRISPAGQVIGADRAAAS